MKTVYRMDENRLIPEFARNPQILDDLPPGVYSVGAHPAIGFYLSPIEPFTMPPKVYGSINQYAGRILSTFEDRTDATGVLLTGEKGSGKSLLAKMLSAQLLRKGVSTIVVNAPYSGDGFNAFMQRINAPAMVLFDEYEKVYSAEQQQGLLTLMDGTYPSKKLFVLTCNSKYRVDTHMRNRPGRLYYSIDFQGMTEADVMDYVKQELKNQAHAESVVRFSSMFYTFNFDMLKAIVQEMNRYDEPASAAYKMLNAKPDDHGNSELRYTIEITRIEDKKIMRPGRTSWRGVPFVSDDEIELGYFEKKMGTDENDKPIEIESYDDLDVNRGGFISELSLRGVMAYKSACEKFVVRFVPDRPVVANYNFMF